MTLVDGQGSGDEGAGAPRRAAPAESREAAGLGEPGCQRAQVWPSVAGSDGGQALPTITGCTLCRRSVAVGPGIPGAASFEPRGRVRVAAAGAWPPRGLDCPYLSHPSNQRRADLMATRPRGRNGEGRRHGILS
ncbi:MAG TPA: hypothetical protein VKY26_07985 [Actinomycetota bacterium]|nr:hypothetical protein [Actinomycetota bacterium]